MWPVAFTAYRPCKCLNRLNPSCMAGTHAAWYSECVCNFKLRGNATVGSGCQESWQLSELQLRTCCSSGRGAAAQVVTTLYGIAAAEKVAWYTRPTSNVLQALAFPILSASQRWCDGWCSSTGRTRRSRDGPTTEPTHKEPPTLIDGAGGACGCDL
jgi:hypothetical protein